MEAMACGVVPVVPDLGDLAEVVDHGQTGLVYPAGDAAGLESGIAMLVENPAERRRIGLCAAKEASRHSWNAIARTVLQSVFESGGRNKDAGVLA
jgi:phosphatidylinositol alpha-mannosyltransferase